MALHRDIFWVGRQWAVTGYGLQAIDQKQKSKFDIEASRLWEDGLTESLQAQPWFNPDDFNKGLSVARERYPQPTQPAPPASVTVSPAEDTKPIDEAKLEPVLQRPSVMVKNLNMHIERWPAKFTLIWRVRIKQ
jgi:hypothetical protein